VREKLALTASLREREEAAAGVERERVLLEELKTRLLGDFPDVPRIVDLVMAHERDIPPPPSFSLYHV
jgi:hypothetical protein